jgi:hypothetical protein
VTREGGIMLDKANYTPIKNYEDRYAINENSEIISFNRFSSNVRKIKPTDNGYGYLIVGFCKNNKRKNHYVHELMASTFISERPLGYVVNHKDIDKKNNNISNLEWVSVKDNIYHSKHKMKRQKSHHKISITGYKYIGYRKNLYRVIIRICDLHYDKSFKDIDTAIAFRNEVLNDKGISILSGM